jgi:cation diffusion facilitator family transporter
MGVMTQARRLSFVLALNIALIALLVVVGFTAHSLGVLAQAVDVVADACALALGLFAVHLRDRHGKRGATNVVALVNAGWLLLATVAVVAASVRRLIVGSPEVHGIAVLVASLISAACMFAGALVLGTGAGREDLHMRSVLLDTLADGAASLGVAAVGLVIAVSGRWFWLDPAVAIAIGLVIAWSAARLLSDVIRALRAGREVELDLD